VINSLRLVLPSNNYLRWKCQSMTNTLAYYDMELIADLDFLIMQAPISPKVKILSLLYLMVRQCFEPDHDLAEVVNDTDEADGGQDEQQDKDQRVSKHSLQRG
jgi:hypothetical protein